MSEKLFSEFESVSSKQWKQKIQVDLKGADYNDTLIWKTNEGIDVKPFYHSDEVEGFQNTFNLNTKEWQIGQIINVVNQEEANTKAVDALYRGAESIVFNISNESIDVKRLLEGIDTSKVHLHFKLNFLSSKFVEQLTSTLELSNIIIHTDIIENLAKSGNWFNSLQEDHSQFEAIVNHTSNFSINLSLYQNAGATMVQQLAYALAHANEYLNHLFNNKEAKKKSVNVTFNTSVGTNYFFEIAKLRALRILWKTLACEYDVNEKCHIIVTPTKRNKTLYDYNTNMLRTTTECMSAVLGNADTVCNLPYDAIYHKSNEFGERISRNQLLILKNESYFNAVINPSDGAYYIESLTHQLANKALDLFKNIEDNGGFLKQLKEGTIQRKIKESASKEQEQFNNGEEILLGTNKHPNKNDSMKNDLELDPFLKKNPRKTLIEPILEKRLAETLEQERLKTE